MAKIEVIRFFSTWDASGVVSGQVGDKLEVGRGTAERLVRQGFAKKARTRKVKGNGE